MPLIAYGLLALLQIWLLPGAVLLVALRWRGRWTEAAIAAFGASWLVNHALVVAFVAAGCHARGTWLVVIAVELAVLGWSARRALLEPLGGLLGPRLARRAAELRALDQAPASALLFALAGGSLLLVALFALRVPGEVFLRWDDVVSWNRWAQDWAAGRWPRLTWHYPQLLPSGWSVGYALLGTTELTQLARLSMAPFVVLIALMPVELALRRGVPAALAAPAATLWLQLGDDNWSGLTSGYADTAAAFFALLPAYLLVAADGERGTRRVCLGAALSAAGGLCKQSAVLASAAYPALVFALLGLRRWRLALAAACVAGVIGVPWYAAKELQIHAGGDSSEAAQLAALLPGAFVERWALAAEHLRELIGLGAAGVPLVAALVLAGLARPWARPGLLAVGLPWAAVWASYLCYDTRNLAPALPHLGWGLAAGLGLAAGALARGLPVVPPVPPLGVARAIAGGLGLAGTGLALMSIWHVDDVPWLNAMVSPHGAVRFVPRVALPLLALLLGLAAHRVRHGGEAGSAGWLLGAPRWRFAACGRWPAGTLIGLPVLGALLAWASIDEQALRDSAQAQQLELAGPVAPAALARHDAGRLAGGRILTDVGLLHGVPRLGLLVDFFNRHHADRFARCLADPETRHVLLSAEALGEGEPWQALGPALAERLREELAAGRLREVERFEDHVWFERVR